MTAIQSKINPERIKTAASAFHTRKLIAVFTLTCFLFTSVFSQGLYALVEDSRQGAGAAIAAGLEKDLVPCNRGRITDARDFGGDTVVINIQDLHCHPEVQRNIAKILESLDKKYVLGNVYVEGGYGEVDTSWLCNIKNAAVKKKAMEALVDQGRLTGGEYYSAAMNRPHLLKGLEDEALHRENIVRLGKILEKKGYFLKKIDDMHGDLRAMEAKYLRKENRRFSRLIEDHARGRVETGKYYERLSRYAAMLNRDPDNSNNVFDTGMENYPDIHAYLKAQRMAKHINFRRTSRQLQAFLRTLKSELPYKEYTGLVAALSGASGEIDMYGLQEQLSRHPGILARHAASFPDLFGFFEYTRLNQTINPLKLVEEEKQLIVDIRIGLSADVSELEVSSLVDLFGCFRDFLTTSLTADDHAYFEKHFDQFRTLWDEYAVNSRLSGLSDDLALLNRFYEVNCRRNESFLKNMGIAAAGTGQRTSTEGKTVIVVVTGGFHSEGLKALLQERKISYVVITPNVTSDTQAAGMRYIDIATEQARAFGSQGLALALSSMGAKVKSISNDKIFIEINGKSITIDADRDTGEFSLEGAFTQIEAKYRGAWEQIKSNREQAAKIFDAVVAAMKADADPLAAARQVAELALEPGNPSADNKGNDQLPDTPLMQAVAGIIAGIFADRSADNGTAAGLSADEYAKLKAYVAAFVERHHGQILNSADEVLASLVDENRFAPDIRFPPRPEAGPSRIEWTAQVYISRFHRDLLNAKDNEEVRRIVRKLYERKLLVKREDVVRDYLRKLKEHPDKLSQEEKGFLAVTDPDGGLVSQGVVLSEIADFSSSRAAFPGAVVNRITLEKGGKKIRFFLKGVDRASTWTREGWKTELYEAFSQDLGGLLGMKSVVSTYSPEKPGDPLVAGFTLLQEIPGEGSNALVDIDNLIMTLRQRFVPFKGQLVSELARLAVVSDLLHKIDRRIVQNDLLVTQKEEHGDRRNEKPGYDGNAIMAFDDKGRLSLSLIDNNQIFNETNYNLLWHLGGEGGGEMGMLTAFPGFLDPDERKRLLTRYENVYKKYWREMYEKRDAIKMLVINTFGADSREYGYFLREIERDPADNLREQEEALESFMRYRYTLLALQVPYSAELELVESYTPQFLAEHGAAIFQNRDELLESLADRNRLSLALYPADPGSSDGGAAFTKVRNRYINGMNPDARNRIFTGKLFLPSREEQIRNFIAGAKDRPAKAADPFFAGLDDSRPLQEQGVSVSGVADLSADTIVYLITLERNGGKYTFFLKGFPAGAADDGEAVYFDEKDDPLIKRIALSEAVPLTGNSVGPVKAVILDWDDTIMFEMADLYKHNVRAILNIWFGRRDFGEETEQWQKAKQFIQEARAAGRYMQQWFSDAVEVAPEGNKSGQTVEQLIAAFRKGVLEDMLSRLPAMKENLEAALTPGVLSVIKQLKAYGNPLYIVSANTWLVATNALEKLGLSEYFEEVHNADGEGAAEFTKEKVIQDILSRKGLKPDEALMIGDSIKDQRAADANGTRFLAVVKSEAAQKIFTAAGVEALLPLGAWFARSAIVRGNDGAVTVYPGIAQKAVSAKAGDAAFREKPAVQAGGAIGHIVLSADLPREQSVFVSPGAPYAHVWFSDMPPGEKKERLWRKSIVIINGKTVEVGYEAHHGSVIFYMGLQAAGIARKDYGEALQEGAAQLVRYFGGTDNLSAGRQAEEFLRDRLGSSLVPGRKGSKPLMLVDHVADAEGAKIHLAEQGINTIPVFAADTLAADPAENVNVQIRKRLIKRNTVSAVMGENKILELDYVYDRVSKRKVKVNDIATFKKALKIFNAVGNRQVQEDWETFAAALDEGKITDKGLKEMLADARRHGVIVHAGYTVKEISATTVHDIKKLYDLGFQSVSLDLTKLTKEQADGILTALKGFPLTSVAAPAGVESSAPEVSILLNEADGYTFKPDDVIDVTIPDTMNEADIERYLRYLPLRNTIIFHSGDIAQLIGSTRDPLSRKAFAALFALLSNVGKVEITTPEQARRLAYNTILKDGLSYAVADELPTNELKQAFFEAMKERALIRDRLAEEDRDLAAAYEEGRYKFNNREFEEILGKTLLKRSQMGKTERDADQAASVPLKANSRDNMSSLVFGLQEEILQGKAPPGFLSAVADIIVTDVIMDYRVKNSAHIENTGTINIQTVEAVLKAA